MMRVMLILLALLAPLRVLAQPAPPTDPAAWQPLAAEWAGFRVEPTRWVRFGDGAVWVHRRIVGGGYRCDDGLFAGELRKVSPGAFTAGKVRRCELGPLAVDALLPDWQGMPHAVYGGGSPQQMHLPAVDWQAIPHRGRGVAELRVDGARAADQPPSRPYPAGGEFRISCGFSHFAADDALVRPGKVGGSHLHMFFGNSWADAHSTAESVATRGGSTCFGGTLNRSAYWVPALLDERGRPLVPGFSLWYYKSGLIDAGQIQPFPPGFAAIAGSASRANLSEPARHHWSCGADGKVAEGWKLRTTELRRCAPGDTLHAFVPFPNCWDGRNARSADHKSHLAYSVSSGKGPAAPWHVCPASHPVALPELSLNLSWLVPAGADTLRWRLSSDAYPADLPGGRSMHADFMSGWQPDALAALVRECYHRRADCGSNVLPSFGALRPPLSGSAYPAEPSLPPAWPHPPLAGPWVVRSHGALTTRPTRLPGGTPGTVGEALAGRVAVGADCTCSRPAYTGATPGSSPWCPVPAAGGALAVCSAGAGD